MALPNTIANSLVGLNINAQNQSVTTLAGTNYSVSPINWSDLLGTKYADVISGSASAEAVNAGAGNDTVKGSDGADTINGGAGNDLVDYSASNSAITINLSNGNEGLGGYAAGDILTNVENITGTAFEDNITGNGSNNILTGGAGNDSLSGKAGNDKLDAGIGNDLLNGGMGADILNGGAGLDTAVYSDALAGVNVNLAKGYGISGEAMGDRYTSIENVKGSNFNDILTGDAGNNVLEGGNGNDFLVGGAGADTINGGEGIDTVSYAGALQGVSVNLNGVWETIQVSPTETVSRNSGHHGSFGHAEGDFITNVEKIIGSAYNDSIIAAEASATTIEGGAGNDWILGLAGNEVLNGGSGNDSLYGGSGNNVFSGGSGDDSFENSIIFGTQHDIITDFQAGNKSGDVITFEHKGVNSYTDLMSHAVQMGNNTVFTFNDSVSGEQKLTLQNVIMSQLNEGDFNFRFYNEGDPIFEPEGIDVLDTVTGVDVLVPGTDMLVY